MADDKRILLKRNTVSGSAAGTPSEAPSSDHTDGTWDQYDCYPGELYANTADGRLFMANVTGVGFIEFSAIAGMRRTIEIAEDFFGLVPALTSGYIGKYGWTASASGIGSVVLGNGTLSTATGISGYVDMTTGTSATDSVTISLGENTIDGNIKGALRYEWYIKIDSLSTGAQEYSINAGIADAYGLIGSISDSISFTYDRTRSTNWLCSVIEGGAETATSSGVAVSTGWVRLAVYTNADWTAISFFINDVLVHTETGANIPIASGSLMAPCLSILKSVGTTPRKVSADYFFLRRILTAAR